MPLPLYGTSMQLLWRNSIPVRRDEAAREDHEDGFSSYGVAGHRWLLGDLNFATYADE